MAGCSCCGKSIAGSGSPKRLGEVLPDRRDPERITHPLETLLQQRLYGLALGYDDLNDHDALGHDLVWQTAAPAR